MSPGPAGPLPQRRTESRSKLFRQHRARFQVREGGPGGAGRGSAAGIGQAGGRAEGGAGAGLAGEGAGIGLVQGWKG